ncbi:MULTISPECIES: metal/formaldehyde-sensitive transcriptional repressor [Acinetobacter]|jgi:FrmR/RcnR family transcriptional regulator, repressor of rcnA expression|uniref:metal/formaldehyde-sensitive transcriptional repressor n=1 Tax=Acinetobacter TaxID=469 RepID=UPI0004D50192|nr:MULTISPECIES: metal/formaldehyde-sensitive transcriptional repressor [Acinetobacter]KEC84832.1 transcriptional repressor RcnR to maintain nickel and cobalt homeostasis [Acinetobacter sp. ETR1]MCG7223018.1 metal/formaldehyde-sensitive transcriptional repressor [Acinetobacter sp. AG3]MDI1222157.1 metal/formaldehyde-sensitive transcriptional repressor [Acinetobacter sp.]UOH18616.1 metal/formaldehyde-sensitive transcriptional repressor [Acinetobacter sp. NyZ410]WEE39594.1 metal/formaldehyde-sen
MSHLHQDKKVLNRVKRLKGQIHAIEEALNDQSSSCISVLQQVAAIKGAVNGLMNELIEQHLTEHVIKDAQAVDEAELQEFLKLLKRYS